MILGTGGTIAGSGDDVGYAAGQLGVAHLAAAVPALAGLALEAEQVAQVDSKDMSHAVWLALATRLAHHLARSEVAGIVVTHGTDTVEETAWFLQRVLAPTKPVVLTAAMRPATSLQADGPQNLLDAVTVAFTPGARGVVVSLQGRVHAARDVFKAAPFALDAFSSGEAGSLALVRDGVLQALRPWPTGDAIGVEALGADPADWPRVAIVVSHAGAEAVVMDSLVAAGMRGLVIEGTGNGTVHADLLQAAERARGRGVAVVRATRCTGGTIVGAPPGALPTAGGLSPAKARVELMLQLMARGAAAGDPAAN